ncbi:MAG: hypothetical protein ABSG48_07370 [Geobacteraceae bacterium]|jgi:hypothetical protein
MKRFTLNTRNVAILLLFISLLFYGIDFLVFGHAPDIAAGFLGNFAFLPIYVLFVTLVIERVIRERERQVIRQKLNMVIGLFFNEVGTDLLRNLTGFLDDPRDLIERLKVTVYWSDREFKEAASFLARCEQKVDSRTGDLACLRDYLVGKKGALLGLLENPNLLEHEAFTDLLWAVSHLLQELEARKSLTGLPDTDLNHLSGDIQRAYTYLLREWLIYMQHLKADYPYLFSLAVRMNPMDPEARPEVM